MLRVLKIKVNYFNFFFNFPVTSLKPVQTLSRQIDNTKLFIFYSLIEVHCQIILHILLIFIIY